MKMNVVAGGVVLLASVVIGAIGTLTLSSSPAGNALQAETRIKASDKSGETATATHPAPQSVTSDDDLRNVSEWILFSNEITTRVLEPFQEASSGLGQSSDESNNIAVFLAGLESRLRAYRQKCAESQSQLQSIERSYRSPPVRAASAKLAKLLDEVVDGCSECIKILEEVNGDAYRFMARKSEFFSALETLVQASNSFEIDDENQAVRESAKRIFNRLK